MLAVEEIWVTKRPFSSDQYHPSTSRQVLLGGTDALICRSDLSNGGPMRVRAGLS